MATSLLPLLFFLCIASISFIRSSAALSLCPRSQLAFLDELRSQCPLWIERSSPLEVGGESLDRELRNGQRSAYYSVLFYASWCPFSRNIRPIFDALSSMFPQIRHIAVEESSALPSIFARYRVHSFPAVILANRTTRVQYYGSKDLNSLVQFYKETTGLDPLSYFAVDEPRNSVSLGPFSPWDGSIKETICNEPYLAFALLFICLKTFIRFFPAIFSGLKAFLAANVWRLKMGIFGDSNHLLERALHVVDVKRLCRKLRVCNKTGNFHKGAKNARVWASSLASVSLGESSSSSRLAPPLED